MKIWILVIPFICFIVPSINEAIENHCSILVDIATGGNCSTDPVEITGFWTIAHVSTVTGPTSCIAPVDTTTGFTDSSAAACSLQRFASTSLPFSTQNLWVVVSRSCGPYFAAIDKPVPEICSLLQRIYDPSNLSVSQKFLPSSVLNEKVIAKDSFTQSRVNKRI